MAKLSIYWTLTAIKQRNYIFAYWNERNKNNTYSKKLNIAIKERISILIDNPRLGKPTQHGEVRGISLGHYSIFYKIQGTHIYITALWDNRQKPQKLIKVLRKK